MSIERRLVEKAWFLILRVAMILATKLGMTAVLE